MCRWLAYSGSEIPIDHVLLKPKPSLIDQSLHSELGATTTNGDGFGMGWYETPDDPHSPVIYGLKKILLEGAELYQVQARNPETLEKYGAVSEPTINEMANGAPGQGNTRQSRG